MEAYLLFSKVKKRLQALKDDNLATKATFHNHT